MSDATTDRMVLADLRKRAGLTQTEVAKRMGVNRPRVGQIEQDFPQVRFNVVASYIRAVGMRAEFLNEDGYSVCVGDIAPDPRGPRDHGYRKKQ